MSGIKMLQDSLSFFIHVKYLLVISDKVPAVFASLNRMKVTFLLDCLPLGVVHDQGGSLDVQSSPGRSKIVIRNPRAFEESVS